MDQNRICSPGGPGAAGGSGSERPCPSGRRRRRRPSVSTASPPRPAGAPCPPETPGAPADGTTLSSAQTRMSKKPVCPHVHHVLAALQNRPQRVQVRLTVPSGSSQRLHLRRQAPLRLSGFRPQSLQGNLRDRRNIRTDQQRRLISIRSSAGRLLTRMTSSPEVTATRRLQAVSSQSDDLDSDLVIRQQFLQRLQQLPSQLGSQFGAGSALHTQTSDQNQTLLRGRNTETGPGQGSASLRLNKDTLNKTVRLCSKVAGRKKCFQSRFKRSSSLKTRKNKHRFWFWLSDHQGA